MIPKPGWIGARSAKLGVAGAVTLALSVGSIGCSIFDGTDEETPTPEVSTVPTPNSGEAPNDQQSGDAADSVLFGQSAAFTGPAQELGRNMRLGIQAAFHEVNQRGGVHGRRLELSSLDDAYEPEAAVTNTIRLIEQDNVFALIGEVGTPTSRSATPVAAEGEVPFMAPFTGAEFLRTGPDRDYIINMRASYYQETEEMVERLTTDLGIDRIAVMYQDDSFGRAGRDGVRIALTSRNMEPVSIGLYPRNTTAVKTALLDLMRGAPEAVIMIGAYEPVAALIAWARHTGLDPVFMTVSFVGSNALAKELGPVGEGVYVTQVVPFPTDDSVPAVSSYLSALSAFDPEATPGFVSLEGYLAGRLAIAALEGCGQEIDRACFLNSLRNADVIDIDGFELRYGQNDNQGSDTVFLTTIGSDGKYRPVETLRD